METSSNFSTFRDCLVSRVIAQPGVLDSPSDNPDSLDDFTSYLATETWPGLPVSLRSASYESRSDLPDVDTLPLESIPLSFFDTLVSCGITEDADAAMSLLRKVLLEYVAETCAPPPVWSKTRTSECQICEREVPLTYHHLIPRQVHAKALKKQWHREAMLDSVAWLCRPCHSTVHHVASNEDLAKKYYTVDLLLERKDIQKWRKYISKQRWAVKRG
ncbi:uncharacterized protein LAESUDRAFT_788844 [Laetiporus sulphureus 93-53]|uniref:HNH domain-containing protein n=1 Tax=Laetiporus sulphureus 93-53 TaxID=1314785 RepID=A0A165GUR6_9APHY|nr:uncharacterized protein LAESUDRAFT_788844 [Laetiporus sulphureus 93-53]KZT10838.1 hypothetical protein LAESUDRAFT_788844 [Laetiporus sulphureus 93-53]